MAELTQLFHDMEELVIEQDQPIQQIEEQVGTAQHDIEQGVGHTNKAVKVPNPPERRNYGVFHLSSYCYHFSSYIGCILWY